MKDGEIREDNFVEEISWGGVLGAELAFRNLIWEVRAHGPEWAGAGGQGARKFYASSKTSWESDSTLCDQIDVN